VPRCTLQVIAANVIALAASCARPSLYQSWGKQLVEASRHNARVEDVSLLLGSPPSRCESLEQSYPVIGITMNPERPIIDAVQPRSPAELAGLRAGDEIVAIAGQPISKSDQVGTAIRAHAREGEPIDVKTPRGSFPAVPSLPKAEQCYWELQAGGVARAGGAAVINQWGGSAGASSSAYQRFFRASCRVHDGFIANCQANWQE
jgi:hypothetical protein